MSYTFLEIEGTNILLPRRDLFDVRFQLISSEEEEPVSGAPGELAFVDAPSDLVPGVYEGGLKTWECSIDLAGHLGTLLDKTSGDLPYRFLEVRSLFSIPPLVSKVPPDSFLVRKKDRMWYCTAVASSITRSIFPL